MGGRVDEGAFAYYDTTEVLKCIWEVFQPPKKLEPTYRWPENGTQPSPARIKVSQLTQACIVVKDVQKTIESYWNIFGIGPWEVHEHGVPIIYKLTYRGKPGNFSHKVAFAMVGTGQLELIQPVSGGNIYSDFLAEHGEGLHHLQFQVSNLDETTKLMSKEGFPVLMGGRVGEGAFAYYDTTEVLKCIWEVFQPPKKLEPTYRWPE
jgi:catechol 2,3-dioxygenase-like lactoylglutathione lyase family enzyme